MVAWLPKTPLPKERSEERFTVERVLLSRGMPKERFESVDIPKERGRACDCGCEPKERLPVRSGLSLTPPRCMLPKVRLPKERLVLERLVYCGPACAHVRRPGS